MLENILKYLNNHFYAWQEVGGFIINDNKIKVKANYVQGQYIRITGSILNNGVYQIKNVEGEMIELEGLTNEIFEGCIFGLAIPKDLLKLAEVIEEYEKENKKNNVISESFGGYSYTKATDKSGNIASWESVYFNALCKYRRIYDSYSNVEVIK